MTTSAELALVDTNVLVYAIDERAPHHESARRLLERAQDEELRLCVTPQVAAEFYAVVTNASRVDAPRTSAEAGHVLTGLLAMPGMTLLPIPSNVVSGWLHLTDRHGIRGPRVFDAQIAATMLAHSVTTIYTYNRRDFESFDGLTVLTP